MGTQAKPCADNYHGPHAFSEPESRAMRDLFLSLRPSPVLTVGLHSAVGTLMYGYGHDPHSVPENYRETVRDTKRNHPPNSSWTYARRNISIQQNLDKTTGLTCL